MKVGSEVTQVAGTFEAAQEHVVKQYEIKVINAEPLNPQSFWVEQLQEE